MAGQAKILSYKEIVAVFKLLESARDRLIFALGVYTGMRVSEIISLTQVQVFSADGGVKYFIAVKRLKKKNTTYSDIPVHPKLRQSLKEYRSEVKENVWLFPSSESVSGRLSRTRGHLILSEAFQTLKLDGASTHLMRRSCLTYMSRAGIPLRTIQSISGHLNLGQLQAYLVVDPEDQDRAINVRKY